MLTSELHQVKQQVHDATAVFASVQSLQDGVITGLRQVQEQVLAEQKGRETALAALQQLVGRQYEALESQSKHVASMLPDQVGNAVLTAQKSLHEQMENAVLTAQKSLHDRMENAVLTAQNTLEGKVENAVLTAQQA